MEHPQDLQTGSAGLKYPITQVSLAVTDLDKAMELYHQAFGWAPWQVFDHVPPVHHNTQLRGTNVHYALRGAEVYVGKMNFELLQPLEGPNLWSELIERRGEGIASIATMFLERRDGDAVKTAFLDEFGIKVSMKADIGDHIEYFYLDTEDKFGCLIESGSGHAIDFVKPAKVHPYDGAKPMPAPSSGITYPVVTQISTVVRDLDARVRAYHKAFGWGPWKIYESDGEQIMHHCTRQGKPIDPFRVRWAEAMIGDETSFELVEPLGGWSPWQEFLDAKGEGICSVSVTTQTREESERVKAAFAKQGVGIHSGGRIGDQVEWYYLDTEPGFKCLIKSGFGRTFDVVKPTAAYP
jgi:predicted enzyme related to lactoylglutathione lyase